MSRLIVAIPLMLALTVASPAADKKVKPIDVIPTAKGDVFDKGGKSPDPVGVTTERDLEKAIPDEATRKRIAKLVDFSEQTLLVVAWQGSGADKLEYTVAESSPERVTFAYKPGATDDLKSHVKLYVVRKDVKWSVK